MVKKVIAAVCVGLIALLIPLSLLWGDGDPTLAATTDNAATQQVGNTAANATVKHPRPCNVRRSASLPRRTSAAICAVSARSVASPGASWTPMARTFPTPECDSIASR